jgi:hypothetical protein
MANILILGDTWGITPCHIWAPNSQDPKDWFEFQFLKRGHPTFNKSWGGNQNHYQLAQAEVFLNATKDTSMEIDLIVWFHSELMRDLGESASLEEQNGMFEEFGFDQTMDIIAERIYGRVTRLKQEFPKTKWSIIGGHAPIRANRSHLLDWVEFRIDNWRQEISGKECPESHAFEFLERGKGSLYDYPAIGEDIIQRELLIKEKILEATMDTNLFYNKKHPAKEPLTQLANRIIDHFKI